MRKTVIFLSLFFISCPLLTLGGKALSSDSSPPRFLEASVPDEESVRLTFDKKCAVVENRLMIGELSVSEIQTSEDGVITVKTAPQIPGKEYVVDITVTDGAGNTTTLLWAFYGFNSRLPTIQLNEISVNASGNNGTCSGTITVTGIYPATVDFSSLRVMSYAFSGKYKLTQDNGRGLEEVEAIRNE